MRIRGLKKKINPIYWEKAFRNSHPIQIYFGGASSGKSWDVGGTRTVLDLLKGRNYLVLRKIGSTIYDSIWKEITEKINDFGLSPLFRIQESKRQITCLTNNAQAIFKGLDDREKIKSIRAKKGPITDILIEEATEIDYHDFKQLGKRLRGETYGFKKRITLLFNPIFQTHWIYKSLFVGLWRDDKRFVENDEVSILKTTYKDNNFLTKDDIDGLENESDPYYHNVYTLGNWGVLGSVIFKNWVVEDFDKTKFSQYRNGVDWGFENPFGYLRIAIEREQKKLYICDEVYQTQLTNDKSGAMVKERAHAEIVWCDCAEPKSIKEYKMMGIMAKPTAKGKGTVLQGIKDIQKFKRFNPSLQ